MEIKGLIIDEELVTIDEIKTMDSFNKAMSRTGHLVLKDLETSIMDSEDDVYKNCMLMLHHNLDYNGKIYKLYNMMLRYNTNYNGYTRVLYEMRFSKDIEQYNKIRLLLDNGKEVDTNSLIMACEMKYGQYENKNRIKVLVGKYGNVTLLFRYNNNTPEILLEDCNWIL